jgi:RNA polymerase subunit RPABC4/transcription elongation factor Spt4
MILDPVAISSLILFISAFGAAFVAALWLALIFWVYRDIRSRTRDPLIRIVAVLVTTILFLPGILIYLIMRPAHSLDQEYQQTLEEEALLQTIEDPLQCPGCARKIEKDWIICPNCQSRLKKSCHHCHKPMEITWNLCPYCGTPEPGMRRENLTMDEALRTLPTESQE